MISQDRRSKTLGDRSYVADLSIQRLLIGLLIETALGEPDFPTLASGQFLIVGIVRIISYQDGSGVTRSSLVFTGSNFGPYFFDD